MTKLLLSWDPGILRSWACYSAWKWCFLIGPWGSLVCLKPRCTSTDQKEPKLLVRHDSYVLAPAVTGMSQLVWNRCCVPLTSDPKILGMLGCLGNGESFGTLGIFAKLESKVALHWLRLEGSPNVSFSNCHSTYNISSAVCPFGELRKSSENWISLMCDYSFTFTILIWYNTHV